MQRSLASWRTLGALQRRRSPNQADGPQELPAVTAARGASLGSRPFARGCWPSHSPEARCLSTTIRGRWAVREKTPAKLTFLASETELVCFWHISPRSARVLDCMNYFSRGIECPQAQGALLKLRNLYEDVGVNHADTIVCLGRGLPFEAREALNLTPCESLAWLTPAFPCRR